MFSSEKVGCANCVKPSDMSYLPIFYSDNSLRPRVKPRVTPIYKKLNHIKIIESIQHRHDLRNHSSRWELGVARWNEQKHENA